MDLSSGSKSGLPWECETESRIEHKVEEYADINYRPCGKALSESHSADSESTDLTFDESSVQQNIKQRHLSEQSITSQDDSNSEVSDSEEFSDLLQQCYPKLSNSSVAAQQIVEDRNGVISTSKPSYDSIGVNRCPVCMKIFNELRHMKRHVQRKHSSERPYQCTVCDKSYSVKSELTQHIKHLHGNTKYYCDMCDFQTNYSQHLKLHISAVHLEKVRQKCPQCDSCFSQRKSLLRHIRSVHTNAGYSNTGSDVHGRSVSGREKPFACNLCDYKCGQKGHLSRHKSTAHPGVKCFSCSKCDFKTSTRSNLDQHLNDIHDSLMMTCRDKISSTSIDIGTPSGSQQSTNMLPCGIISEKLRCPADADLMDQSSASENGLSEGCERESRVTCKAEDCVDMNNDSHDKMPTQDVTANESSEMLNQNNSDITKIKQEHLSEQSDTEVDDSSNDLSDDGEFTDLLQRCYPKSNSDVAISSTHMQTAQGMIGTSKLLEGCLEYNRCFMCMKTFCDLQHLKRHIKRKHSNDRQYHCTQCDKSYGIRADLNQHVKAVHADKVYYCDMCEFHSNNSQHLKSHRATVHLDQIRHNCPHCDSCFAQKKSLNRHIRSLHASNIRQVECSACDRKFTRPSDRDSHWRTVHCGEKRYACDHCDYKCSQKGHLTRHQGRKHPGVKCGFRTLAKGFTMNDIEKTSSASNGTETSTESQHGKTVLPYEVMSGQEKLLGSAEDEDTMDESSLIENSLPAGYESESRVKLEVEECADMSNDSYDKTHVQHIAGVDSSAVLNENNHDIANVKREHLPEQSDTEIDDSSNDLSDGEEFTDLLQRCYPKSNSDVAIPATHISRETVQGMAMVDGGCGQDVEMYIRCLLCNKSFTSAPYLTDHIQRVHLNDRPHACTQCDKAFIARSELTKHMKRVHGDRIYNCDRCDYSSRDMYRLKSHISAVHLEEKTHKCLECDSCFSHKGHLTQHINAVHNQEKPFECSGCDKRFSRRQYRDAHWRTVHCGEKPFSCDRCDSKFSHKSNLTQHVRSVHEKDKSFSSSIRLQESNIDTEIAEVS